LQEEQLVEPDYYQLVTASTIEPLLFVSANSSLPRVKHDPEGLAKFTAVRSPPHTHQDGSLPLSKLARVMALF
jgi:hypothetical protein